MGLKQIMFLYFIPEEVESLNVDLNRNGNGNWSVSVLNEGTIIPLSIFYYNIPIMNTNRVLKRG